MNDEINKTNVRELNEVEVRAAARLLYKTSVVVRLTIGKWLANKHRPARDELLCVGLSLLTAEDVMTNLAKRKPTNGHDLDILIGRASRKIEELTEQDDGGVA